MQVFDDFSPVLRVEVSAAGVQTVKGKVDPVLHAPAPTDTSGLRSFLGAVTFYARFIPDMSSVAAPLNRLLQKGRSGDGRLLKIRVSKS